MTQHSLHCTCIITFALLLTSCAPGAVHAQTLPTPTIRISAQSTTLPAATKMVQIVRPQASPAAVATNGSPVREAYCLWPGDTLYDIARETRVDEDNLRAQNPNSSIFAGSVLHLPANSLAPAQWTSTRPAFSSINQLPSGESGIYLGYDNRTKRVALTFDIGFETENKDLFETLSRHGIHATFFVLGNSIAHHPEIVADIMNNGHELGNHSWSHLNMQNMTEEQITAELQKTELAVQNAYPGATTKPFFRAPFGAINPTITRLANQAGYYPIGWTIDSHDWMENISAEAIYQAVTRSVCPGAIIAMHDVNQANKDALPRILEFLEENGYQIVPLSDLILPPN
jgi:peptidoglycan/xylan/chitin deacetylase (PgdA/CDA1 family)